jgi:hypothetical protein
VCWNERFSHGDTPGRADGERRSRCGVVAPAVCAPTIKHHVLLHCKLCREQCKTRPIYRRASCHGVHHRKKSCVLSPSHRHSCSRVCERSSVPTISIKSKVHPGVTAVAGGALVVAGSVMAFGGGSGGEVTAPCVGLCVVTSRSQHCDSGSCVGPTGRAVLDDVSHRKDSVCHQ